MLGERTPAGWKLCLRPYGAGRYPTALFLMLWLCAWAAGEAFALWILGKGMIALLTGSGMSTDGEPLELGPALLVGVFLLVWLTIWTIGGIAASATLLRLLWGVDSLVVDSGTLVLTRRHGPFRTTRAFERGEIHRVMLAGTGDKLMLETDRRSFELSDLGTTSERQEAASELVHELGLATKPAPRVPTLPPGWEDVLTPEGERALVPDRGIRRQQAWAASLAALLAATLALVFLLRVPGKPAMLAPAGILAVMTLAIAAGALWLARGRWEWWIGSGRLTLRKRYGANVRAVFEARRLALETSSDSDGDRWYEVTALAASAEGAAPTPAQRAQSRRRVARVMNDPFAMRQLAEWLAHASGLPLEDQTTPAAREAELAEQLRRLERSGWLGQRVAGYIARRTRGRSRG